MPRSSISILRCPRHYVIRPVTARSTPRGPYARGPCGRGGLRGPPVFLAGRLGGLRGPGHPHSAGRPSVLHLGRRPARLAREPWAVCSSPRAARGRMAGPLTHSPPVGMLHAAGASPRSPGEPAAQMRRRRQPTVPPASTSCLPVGIAAPVSLPRLVGLVALEGLLGFTIPFNPFYPYNKEYHNHRERDKAKRRVEV